MRYLTSFPLFSTPPLKMYMRNPYVLLILQLGSIMDKLNCALHLKCQGHFHLLSNAKLNSSTFLMPRPPSSFVLQTLFQLSQHIFLFSSTPPHKKERCIFTISCNTFFGALKKDKKYNVMLLRTAFNSTTLPPIDRCFPSNLTTFFVSFQ